MSACGESKGVEIATQTDPRPLEEVISQPDPEDTSMPVEVTTEAPTSKPPTPVPSSTPEPEFGERLNPVPLGTEIELVWDDQIDFTIQFVEVVRGSEAWSIVEQANMFNEPAPDGYEFILIKAKVVYTGADAGILALDDSDWHFITKGQLLNRSDLYSLSGDWVSGLHPAFDFKLFSGGEAEGWMDWLVAIDDANPLLVMGMDTYDNTGGVYFEIYSTSE